MNRYSSIVTVLRCRVFLAALLLLILLLTLTGVGSAASIWSPTGDLTTFRANHTATLLEDGRVLVAGGNNYDQAISLNSAEIYDPLTESWTLTGPMSTVRSSHTATRLHDGRVLVAGGYDTTSAELYNPQTGSWTLTGAMNNPRGNHTATLLTDGRVLVTGGSYNSAPLKSTEIYNPVDGTWSMAGDVNQPRNGHTATLLPDGRVLVAGGFHDISYDSIKTAELFDPVTKKWTPANDMNDRRVGSGSALLTNGNVLVFGGANEPAPTAGELYPLTSAELFDPLTGTWTPTGDLNKARERTGVVQFADGRVLAVGGLKFDSIPDTELYDPQSGTWAKAGDMTTDRGFHTATLLQDGRVLAAGGLNLRWHAPDYPLKSAELFGPSCTDLPGNIVQNPCFEDGKSPWSFYSNGWASFNVSGPAYGGSYAAKVEIDKAGSNVQLYQSGLPLEPNQQYRLYFAAKSSSGHDVSVYVHKHGYPYTNYGLYNEVVNLDTEWQQFTIDFTTTSQAAADGRLRFWLAPYDAAGDVYWFDNVYLLKVTDSVPEPPNPDPGDPPVPPQFHCDPPIDGNVIGNPGFEAATRAPWSFYSNGSAGTEFTLSDRYECQQALKVNIWQEGSNVQLYQSGLALQPNTAYQLRLAAKSTAGRDVRLYLHKHRSPYTNYGLNGLTLDLTEEWQVFVVQFTTTGFSSPVWDGRLRIWLAESDAPGAHYYFDDVVMTPLDNSMSAATAFKSLDSLESAVSLSKETVLSSTATGQLLTGGFFIDDDDAGRAKGAFIPGSMRGAPQCDKAQPSHAILWPADGRLVKVKIVGAGKTTDLTISGIWQDEAVGPEADGVINGQEAWLRAERNEGGNGPGNGRIYHVAYSATYRGGDICRHEVLVTVPPAKGAKALDDGPLAESTLP